MIRPMKSRFSLSLLLSLSLTSCVYATSAFAAVPVPKEREPRNFDAALESTPQSSRFHRRLDYREEEKQKAKDAEEAQKQAIENQQRAELAQLNSVKKRDQSSVDANNRGVALGQQRRWLESISAHEQACQLDPRNKQYRINLSAARTAYGQEKMQAGDLTAASNLFRKALAAAGDNGMAAKLLVDCMRKQGKDPSNVDLRLDIGEQLCSIGELESATVEFQAAMQLEPSARTFLKMGDMALRYGQVGTATNWYRQAIVKDPNYGPAHRQLGLLALAQRDYTGAAASLRKAVVLDPKDVAAGQSLTEIWRRQVAQNPLLAENHLGLAGALQLTGDFVGAETEYRKLEALDAKNPGLEAGRASLQRAINHAEADKHRVAADTLFGQGLHHEALAEISRAVQMEPRNAKYQFLFAECLELSGNYQQAHQAYLTCVLMDPENNKEAAARMKEMQRNLAGRVDLGQQAAQIANQFGQQSQVTAQQQVAKQQQAAQSAPAAQQAAPAQAPQQRTTGGGMNDIMSKVTSLEADKNLEGAIELLRRALQADLKNPDVHHRLAVDLLSAGQITEAISEFRISSALRPENQDYAADLARAMAIHKRSLGVASSTEVSK
jgi:tetratricopeptide (TPR) repeat protein